MNRRQKNTIYLIRAAMLIFAIVLGIVTIISPTHNKIGGTIGSLILPFAPALLQRFFRVTMSFRLQIIYYAFLFFSLFLGIDLDFYRIVPYYDKIIHLISGALSVIVGHYALQFFRIRGSRWFRIIFMILVVIAIGVLWEFFEFGCDKLLGQNMQQLIQWGVDDTMLDLLMATGGGIVAALWLSTRNLDFLEDKK